MKDIKCKIWDKEKREFIPLLGLSGENDYYNGNYLTLMCQFPERFEKLLFTGLKDRNGKDIYEGDIIKNINAEENEEYPGAVVTWLDGAFGIIEKGYEPIEENIFALWKIRNGIIPDVEVTGNIYENSDLERT